MKTILSTLILSLSFLYSQAINIKRDSVVMGKDYQNDVYYSFDNPRTIVNNSNYHLAFSNMLGRDDKFYTVWLNATTARAYVNPDQKSTDWSQFDASGSDNWRELRNADTSWGKGAFAQGKEAHPRYTWAEYKSNGDLRGDSLYLLKIYNPNTDEFDIEFKLALAQRLSTNGVRTWTFKIGKIDNSWDTTITLKDLEKSKGNLMYFNVMTKEEVVREPATSKWDYVFTRYITFTQQIHYTVTGLLANYNLSSAKVSGNITDPSIDDYLSKWKYDTLINNIGFEWKSFNQSTFKYELEENTVRIIKKDLGNGMADFYAIQFVRFEGRTTGKIVFDYAYLGQFSAIKSTSLETLKFYPNPSQDKIKLNTHSEISQALVYDVYGKRILTVDNPGSNLDISTLARGSYVVQAILKNGKMLQSKMIKF